MKTDRNKNNVKSEENMILEKSRRSDANVFPVENKGKGKIAKAKKRQVKGVIWKTVLQQKWLSMGIVFAVAGAVVTALIPPLILGKNRRYSHNGKSRDILGDFPYFAMLALPDSWNLPGKVCLPYLGRKSHMHLEAALWKNSYALLLTN